MAARPSLTSSISEPATTQVRRLPFAKHLDQTDESLLAGGFVHYVPREEAKLRVSLPRNHSISAADKLEPDLHDADVGYPPR